MIWIMDTLGTFVAVLAAIMANELLASRRQQRQVKAFSEEQRREFAAAAQAEQERAERMQREQTLQMVDMIFERFRKKDREPWQQDDEGGASS